MVVHSPDDSKTRDVIVDLLVAAVNTDGSHHKQWYIEEIANVLRIVLPNHDYGIAP